MEPNGLMDRKTFEDWYGRIRPQLRPPLSPDEISLCLRTPVCKYCPLRSGCPDRPLYYLNETDFELLLQGAEIKFSRQFSERFYLKHIERRTLEVQQFLRERRKRELSEFPDYSYR